MSRQILAVIPARYASTRFPGKPLAAIDGKPMVQWVYEAAVSCAALDAVVVATDDQRIADTVEGFGGRVEFTSQDHETGTDRVAEVSARYPDADIVVNVQGDQPFVTAEILQRLVGPYLGSDKRTLPDPVMTTVACGLEPERISDPNSVKVICDQQMKAIYFSRACIPYFRQKVAVPVFHHLGLYAFKSSFLRRFCQLAQTPLEQAEGLEQLRVIENGYQIQVSLIETMIHEVNVPADLELANSLACT